MGKFEKDLELIEIYMYLDEFLWILMLLGFSPYFRCNICGKEFYEKALFRRHVKKATHGKKGRAKQNLERVCERCGRKFTQLREYRRHMNNHEGNHT